ncbi:DNA translocase FtsK [Candidatus Wolfebacteria bacterium]|nr:DNA translocase FtsK [Candidatus Wolfebacteria bacterium]
MAKKNNGNNESRKNWNSGWSARRSSARPAGGLGEGGEPRLHHETKKSIWALVLIGIGLVLILARFGSAGPFGNFTFIILDGLFGVGYLLVPVILFVLGGALLASEGRQFYRMTLAGAALFVLAGLGLIDIIFPAEGGYAGKFVGFLRIPLGALAAGVVLMIVSAIAFLVSLNLPLRLPKLMRAERDARESETQIPEEKAMPQEAEMAAAAAKEQRQENGVAAVESKSASRPGKVFSRRFKNYVAPPFDLLKSTVEKPTAGDLRANANIIKRTLESFGIPVEMGEINIGPKVTRYTLKPAEGVKLSRITVLNPDLALSLAAHPIRIEAPIPGRSLVGIEVPNKAAAVVRLGSLMAYPEFSQGGPLAFVLGRDVNGDPIFADIDRMPHLLIAGSTGSGKSVAIHSLIVSLLYKNSPETLRFILIDPKRVELSLYAGLPHLVSPVITDPKKAVGVFRWAMNEMDRRYEMLVKAGSRDISSYNKNNAADALPYIVIVIDELADLMVSYGREVEGSIVRLAQMARATGLHLVLSTQRPSVEVVTGLIKANITSRMALQLPSQVDSRTILDTAGAEKLLGGGDMLFVSSELSKPRRIQGAYLSEEEVKNVTDFIRENNKTLESEEASPDDVATAIGEINDDLLGNLSGGDDDELFDEAVRVIREAKKASASLLQRRLKVGYARAARLLDIMEERGIVGPGEGAKARDIYMEDVQ